MFCSNRKFVTTRKPHTCCVCGDVIPQGSSVFYAKTVVLREDDVPNRFAEEWVCLDCVEPPADADEDGGVTDE